MLALGIRCAVVFACLAVSAGADDTRVEKAVRAVVQEWKLGVHVQAGAGDARDIEATVPFPLDWPEQKVEILAIEKSDNVRNVTFRSLGDGAKQMVVTISQLRPGESAAAWAKVRIHRRMIAPPTSTSQWTVPKRVSSSVKPFLLPSPYIDSRHPLIKKAARELAAAGVPAWQQVESIYDWVRQAVRYQFDKKIRSSVDALRAGHGDCEELTSLFIAVCRAANIPARAVWVPGHCYPEFYLVNQEGEGRWFPCQAAGTRSFGGIIEWRPILQKGDRFRVPGKKGWQRYIAETLSARRAAAPLSVKFIREPLGDAIATELSDETP